MLGLALAVLVPAAVLFYGRDFALGRRLLASHDLVYSDFWHFYLPLKAFYAEELQAGRLATWCSLLGTGVPLHAVGEVGMLYPPNLLLYRFLPLPLAVNLSVLGHSVLAGVLAALYAREVGASRAGALLAGLAFGFSGYFVTHARHLSLVAAGAWLPGILWALERCARSIRARDVAVLAVMAAMPFLAGHPQLAYNHALLAGAYAVVLLARSRRPRALSIALLGALSLSLLLASPQILPTLELHAEGPRSGGLDRDFATEFDLHPSYLRTFVQPEAFGDPGRFQDGAGFVGVPGAVHLFWESVYYVGLLPLLFALVAVGLGWRRRQPKTPVEPAWAGPVQRLTLLLVVGLLLALGRHIGIDGLLHDFVPGYDLFRFHSRFLLGSALALAVLGGLGLTFLEGRLAARFPAACRLVAIGIVTLTFLDLSVVLSGHNGTVDAERWLSPPSTLAAIDQLEPIRAEPFRVLSFDPDQRSFLRAYQRASGWHGDPAPYDTAHSLLRDDANVLFGLAQAEFYLPLYPQRTRAATEALYLYNSQTGRSDRVSERIARLLNVRYVLAPEGTPPGPLKRLGRFWGQDGGERSEAVDLYGLPNALPRAFLVPRARTVRKPQADGAAFLPPAQMAALEAITDPGFDPLRELVIDRLPGEPDVVSGSAADPLSGTVRWLERRPHLLRLEVVADRDGWLFVSESPYPGWEATVDGEKTPLFPANLSGRAIAVSAGRHEVVFRYRQGGLLPGFGLMAVGLLVLALLAMRRAPIHPRH